MSVETFLVLESFLPRNELQLAFTELIQIVHSYPQSIQMNTHASYSVIKPPVTAHLCLDILPAVTFIAV